MSSAPATRVATSPRDTPANWPLVDRAGYYAAWAAGLALIAIAGSILVYMAVKGAQYFDLGLLTESPTADLDQSKAGGFKDPQIGTALLTVIAVSVLNRIVRSCRSLPSLGTNTACKPE